MDYGLASRSAKSHYALYYIQMWSGGNERLYSAEGMDFSLLSLSVHTPAPVFPHPMTPTCGGTPKLAQKAAENCVLY